MTNREFHGAMLAWACAIGLMALGCGDNHCPNGAEQCASSPAGLPPGHECASMVSACGAEADWSGARFNVNSSTTPAPGGRLPDVNITLKLTAFDGHQKKCVAMAGELRAAQPSTVKLPFDPGQMGRYPDVLSNFNPPCDVQSLEMTAYPTDAGITCGCKSLRVVR